MNCHPAGDQPTRATIGMFIGHPRCAAKPTSGWGDSIAQRATPTTNSPLSAGAASYQSIPGQPRWARPRLRWHGKENAGRDLPSNQGSCTQLRTRPCFAARAAEAPFSVPRTFLNGERERRVQFRIDEHRVRPRTLSTKRIAYVQESCRTSQKGFRAPHECCPAPRGSRKVSRRRKPRESRTSRSYGKRTCDSRAELIPMGRSRLMLRSTARNRIRTPRIGDHPVSPVEH